VRNAATIGGNMALCREKGFESDVATVLLGMGATIETIRSSNRSKDKDLDGGAHRSEEDLMSYLESGSGLITSLFLPFPRKGVDTIFKTYRVAIRPQNAHALVNAAFRLENEPQSGRITAARLIVGAVNPRHALRFDSIESILIGETLTREKAVEASNALSKAISMKDLAVSSGGPYPAGHERGEYRRGLAGDLLLKFLLSIIDGSPTTPGIDDVERVVARQEITSKDLPQAPVAEARIKDGAIRQTSGEAIYSDDVHQKDPLFAAYSLAPIAKGSLKSLDVSKAKAAIGVAEVITAEDIPGINQGSCAFQSEVLLVPINGDISFHSQPVAIVVADTYLHAREAAKLVIATCEEETPTLNIAECKARNELFSREFIKGPFPHIEICRIDGLKLDEPKKNQDASKEAEFDARVAALVGENPGLLTCQASMQLGSQQHFYMETQSCTASFSEGISFAAYYLLLLIGQDLDILISLTLNQT